jgi:hypothetical protein
MKADPIVDEVHQAREAISKRFNGDLSAICEDARRRQSASGRKTRRLSPHQAPVRPAKAG